MLAIQAYSQDGGASMATNKRIGSAGGKARAKKLSGEKNLRLLRKPRKPDGLGRTPLKIMKETT